MKVFLALSLILY